MSENDTIVGIDLGTTNSEISVFHDGNIQVLGTGNTRMLPSCVGLSSTGQLLIGESARNQQLLYPELTVRSIKRQMGSDETVALGDRTYTPQEVSALILRELVQLASQELGVPVRKAVITVPAYFSDAQRNATREAGILAELEVVRILNEPTAASLAYGYGFETKQTVLIYDLGGGTFDVSIVAIERDVTEVLASHGNNRLGGDDFDQLLVDRFIAEFSESSGVDLSHGYPAALCRLWQAAEEAKKKLSSEPFVKIREEALVTIDGKPLHFESEISREAHEELVGALIESTLSSVSKAMNDAGKQSSDLDAVLLVGGSTRIPLVFKLLEERTGIVPHHDVDPDLCVALGAGVLASRLSGQDVGRVLVDVSPYSFGPSYLGERDGLPYPYCYHPIIRANTPLPVTRTERYFTSTSYQTEVEIDIYQGDDPDAMKNIPIGNFHIRGLRLTDQANVVLCRMNLDLDGILKVTAIEKETGKSKRIIIDNSFQQRSEEEIMAARERLNDMYDSRLIEDEDPLLDLEDDTFDDQRVSMLGAEGFADGIEADEDLSGVYEAEEVEDATRESDADWIRARGDAKKLVERSRALLDQMHDDDKEEAIDLHEQIGSAIASRSIDVLTQISETLKELLFFVEGK